MRCQCVGAGKFQRCRSRRSASFKRLVQLAGMMAAAPQTSLPKQCGSWKDLKAAYRLLNNPAVDPDAIQGTHRKLTRDACTKHAVVLSVEDDTYLSFNSHAGTKGLGKLATGQGRGLVQHSTLAVTPTGELLGLLDEFWFRRVDADEDETRRQRNARWREAKVWSDAVRRVGPAPGKTRFVHIMDRAGDNLETIRACDEVGVGYVIRAKHDRRVQDATDKLWSFMAKQPVKSRMTVSIGKQTDITGRVTRRAREAKLSVRFSRVQLEPSWNHSGSLKGAKSVYAVYLSESRPPKDVDPVDWMLLTGEAVTRVADAERIVEWYTRRWIIEEWHRVEKEGCRVEASQLDDAEDIKRLAAIVSINAVRMLRLRDLAGFTTRQKGSRSKVKKQSENPRALQDAVPLSWLVVVASLADMDPFGLTPRDFWLTIAKRGGWIGRNGDRPPGWKTIWRGWYDVHVMAQGVELATERPDLLEKCG